jgi:hypothetical protein
VAIRLAFDSRIDSFNASRMVSTPCSSTKSSKLRGSSFSGRNAASTIVDLSTSIVDSSRAFAASKVRITLYGPFQPHSMLADTAGHTLKSRCPSLYTFSIPPRTFLKILTCSEMPLLRKPVRALKTTLSSSAARAEVTISFARHTVLMEDRERLEARRCDTRVSRGMSCCAMDRDCDLDEESEAWLREIGGEFDIVDNIMVFSYCQSSYYCSRGVILCWTAVSSGV